MGLGHGPPCRASLAPRKLTMIMSEAITRTCSQWLERSMCQPPPATSHQPPMRTGVLLMAHGTPASLDEMPEYLQLGRDVPVAVGMRNWHPFINDALAGLAASGVERVIGIPMAPQASTIIVHKYVDAAIAGLPQGVAFEAVRSYFAHPLLVEAFAEQVRAARPGAHETIVFTAHSLPSRVIASGDHYAEEVAATASAVAGRAAIARYECAYQSTGRTPEPWIGPDLCGLIKERVAGGARQFLIVPIGFVCDPLGRAE